MRWQLLLKKSYNPRLNIVLQNKILGGNISIKKTLWEDVLKSYEKEYLELINVWNEIDKKSQIIISVCGIFIAAVFAFVRQITAGSLLLEKILIVILLLGIIITIGFCLRVLRIIYLPKPPYGDIINDLVSDLSNLEEDELKERDINYTRDKISMWKEVNSSISEKLENKTTNLATAQLFLVFSIINMFLITVYFLYKNLG